MTEGGVHSIQVTVCSADEDGEMLPLFVCEPRQCHVQLPSSMCEQSTSSVSSGMPRLMQKDSLVLCGVDIPSQAQAGKLRIMVALKRIWHDAPKEVSQLQTFYIIISCDLIMNFVFEL